MKNFLIFLSILIVFLIAFFDAKERFQELSKVAANTPAQVEMKQMKNKPDDLTKPLLPPDNINDNNRILHEKMRQDAQESLQRQLDGVEKRRNTINNQVN